MNTKYPIVSVDANVSWFTPKTEDLPSLLHKIIEEAKSKTGYAEPEFAPIFMSQTKYAEFIKYCEIANLPVNSASYVCFISGIPAEKAHNFLHP